LLVEGAKIEETDCLLRKVSVPKRWEEIDARACNTDNLVSIERSHFYQWSNEKGITFRRGKALIFYDENHRKYADELQQCFDHLEYRTKLHNLNTINLVIGKIEIL